MKLTVVKELPRAKKRSNRDIRGMLDEFAAMDATIVEIDPIAEGYKAPSSLSSVIGKAIVRDGYPYKVIQRNKKVYLIKKL